MVSVERKLLVMLIDGAVMLPTEVMLSQEAHEALVTVLCTMLREMREERGQLQELVQLCTCEQIRAQQQNGDPAFHAAKVGWYGIGPELPPRPDTTALLIQTFFTVSPVRTARGTRCCLTPRRCHPRRTRPFSSVRPS
jgi:hypothetical protein